MTARFTPRRTGVVLEARKKKTNGNVIAEADGTTGVAAKEYIWLPGAGYAGTDLPVGVVDVAGTATPELLYVHADHLGRPIRLTDPAKVTAWAVEWLPWGGVHTISGSETLNARFPGQWFQVESGLHYNWHRHYDPSLGRYTQPDPLGFVDGPSVYAYAGSRPGEAVDPDGRYQVPDRTGRPGRSQVPDAAPGGGGFPWPGKNLGPPTPQDAPARRRCEPETCSQQEHDRRQDEINRSCKPKPQRCTSPNPQIAALARYCAMLRQEQISKCFGITGGDANHRNEVSDWWKLYASCQ